MSMAFLVNLLNFFEEQWNQNHAQYLSGLSRALFPTTFLKKAVYLVIHDASPKPEKWHPVQGKKHKLRI